jgi:hypothetical protein
MMIKTKYDLTVKVHRRFHRGALRLFLHFEIHNEMQRRVQNALNGRWSRSHKGWYVDDTPEMKNQIIAVCKGLAWYDMREINKFLDPEAVEVVQRKSSGLARPSESKSLGVNAEDFERYIQRLKSQGKSASTIKTYGGMVRRLAQYYNKQLIRKLTPEMLYAYLSEEVVDKDLSNSYHRQLISALKPEFDYSSGFRTPINSEFHVFMFTLKGHMELAISTILLCFNIFYVARFN